MSEVPDFEIALLDKARQDADAAAALNQNPIFEDDIIGFYWQQAVEKAIKAVLETWRVEYPLTHDLLRLLDLIAAHAPPSLPACPVRSEDARQLNPFAVRLRYEPESTDTDPALDRLEGLRVAKSAVEWAVGIVKKA